MDCYLKPAKHVPSQSSIRLNWGSLRASSVWVQCVVYTAVGAISMWEPENKQSLTEEGRIEGYVLNDWSWRGTGWS